MDRQLKFLEQSENPLFADGSSDRLPPINSIPRGNGLSLNAVFSADAEVRNQGDIVFLTGLNKEGVGLSGFPIEVTSGLMRLGKERYDIYCSRCHGAYGDGKGVLAKFGLQPRNLTDPTEPNYLATPIERTVKADDGSGRKVQHGYEGYLAHVMAEGYNTMLGLKDRISPRERWAIALYVRALQELVQSKKVSTPAPAEGSSKGAEE
tara:strand:+ start:143 stop:763 length:621 start_codon:yes stop_codon:yes gene_type:complete